MKYFLFIKRNSLLSIVGFFIISTLFISCDKYNLIEEVEAYQGDWFSTDGTGEYILGIHDSVALYNNKIYQNINLKRKGNKVALFTNEDKILCHLNLNNNQLHIKSGKKNMVLSKEAKRTKLSNKSPINHSFSKKQKTIVQGLIKDFDPEKDSTGIIRHYNLFEVDKTENIIKINQDGTYKVELELYFPQKVTLFLPNQNQFLYLIPGETSTHLHNGFLPLSMGKATSINDGINELEVFHKKIDSPYDRNIMEQNINEYKKRSLANLSFKINKLDSFSSQNNINDDALNYFTNYIKALTYEHLVDYPHKYAMQYSKNHNTINSTEFNQIKEDIELPDDYYNFIHEEWLVNPSSFESGSFFSTLLNRLEFAKGINTGYEVDEFIAYLIENKPEVEDLVIKYYNCKSVNCVRNLLENNGDLRDKLNDEYFLYDYGFRSKNVLDHINSKIGFVDQTLSDIFYARQLINIIKDLHLPLIQEHRDYIDRIIQNEEIKTHIYNIGNKIEAENKNSKNNKTNILELSEKNEAAAIIAELMEQHKGKTLLLDFWATWCAPCYEKIALLKTEENKLNDMGIEIIYLADFTSPQRTYEQEIKKIGGSHFRFSRDQINILSDEYGIQGRPYYILIDRNGDILKNDFIFNSKNDFYKQLEKLMQNRD